MAWLGCGITGRPHGPHSEVTSHSFGHLHSILGGPYYHLSFLFEKKDGQRRAHMVPCICIANFMNNIGGGLLEAVVLGAFTGAKPSVLLDLNQTKHVRR